MHILHFPGKCYGKQQSQTNGGHVYMKVLDRIALALVIIGALNWGAVGLFRFDCVAAIFGGQAAPISRVVYALVGLAGLWCITILFRDAPAEE